MKQYSNMEANSTLPECGEKEAGVSAEAELKSKGNVAELSTEQEGKSEEAVSSAVQEDGMKEDLPAVGGVKEAVAEARNIPEAGNSAEKRTGEGSSKKKTVKVLKVKRKIVKKSPASSVSRTKMAQAEQEEKKEKVVPATQEVKETEAQNPTENSGKPESTENSSKPESKTKKINKVLKVKKKIVKKSPASSQKKTNNKVQSSPKVQDGERQENNKSVSQAEGERSERKVEDTEPPNQKDNVDERISKEKHAEKGEETSASHKKNSALKNRIKERKNKGKAGPLDRSTKNQKNKENDSEKKSQREDRNNKNLGGFIFMCSAKTKPDCFHYKVMGVSAGKKDVVLAIKPGLKLFLYDFDLRLLYGVYKASSSGGMKLEPKAFNGAFPAQVRFEVYKDCFPLPESVFKKAIHENYYEKHKFKAELTVKQVRKLSDLFRPVGHHSSTATLRSHPEVLPTRDGRVRGEVKETRVRDSKSKGDARNHHLASHGRDRLREEAPRHREEVPRDLYISEKEYRTYGLRAERRNLDPAPRPSLETYHRDHDRDYQPRHPEPRYRDDVSAHAQREIVRADHVYFNGKDYPIYSVDSRPAVSPPRAISASGSDRNVYDSYYTRQYGPLLDPYVLSSRREEAAPPSYPVRSYIADTEPMRHAAGALSYYNQTHRKDMETDTMPVSSRYSFAGPSFSYR